MKTWKKIKYLLNRVPGLTKLYRFTMRIFFQDKVLGRPLNRGKCPRCDLEALKTRYFKTKVSEEPDTFVLYRIIGNDLPPRHRKGQTIENIRFILENETELKNCEKRFIVNRIIYPDEEKKIIDLLGKEGYPFLLIPFNQEEYLKTGWDFNGIPEEFAPGTPRFIKLRPEEQGRILMRLYRLKNNYVMNNNGARNTALAQGRQLAKWVLPWDGNCFITKRNWDKIESSIKASPETPYFIVPMARITDNQLLLNPDYETKALDEPQIIFRKDSRLSFNENYFYGRRPKVELLWRLGVPGHWDKWGQEPWDLPTPAYADEAGAFNFAGWVARLNSGRDSLEKNQLERKLSRVEAIKTIIDDLDSKVERNI
jgi:hypothetical protein